MSEGYYKNAPDEVLLKGITTLCKNARQSAEMMQGCTNHTSYAEITAKEILTKAREAVEGAGLTDEAMERLRFFGISGKGIPMVQVENIAQAYKQAALKALGGE